MFDRFVKKTDAQIADRERIQREAQQLSDEAIGHAQNCMRNDDFKKYTAEYEKLESLAFQELQLIDAMETDPVKYGFQCKEIVARLKYIGYLLKRVRSDAGKK